MDCIAKESMYVCMHTCMYVYVCMYAKERTYEAEANKQKTHIVEVLSMDPL